MRDGLLQAVKTEEVTEPSRSAKDPERQAPFGPVPLILVREPVVYTKTTVGGCLYGIVRTPVFRVLCSLRGQHTSVMKCY